MEFIYLFFKNLNNYFNWKYLFNFVKKIEGKDNPAPNSKISLNIN